MPQASALQEPNNGIKLTMRALTVPWSTRHSPCGHPQVSAPKAALDLDLLGRYEQGPAITAKLARVLLDPTNRLCEGRLPLVRHRLSLLPLA